MTIAAFLGLGVMGFPMAGHLKAAGHEVRVWNRTGAKAKAWADQHAGIAASSPEEAADGADIVFMCLGDDPDVRAIAMPLLEHMKPGSVLVDHTTASAQLARELHAAAAARGIGFV
ncbi:MAG: NAD(P)-dependent oxidoreductase, partial [Glycocaulis sp.]